MPMSLAGEYLYALAVVAIYGALPAIIVLFVAWRRQRLGVAIRGLFIALPLVALGAQLVFHGNLHLAGLGHAAAQARIDDWLGSPNRNDVLEGMLVDPVQVGGLTYSRYRFPSPHGDAGRAVEIRLPPDGVHAIGYFEVVAADDLPARAPARLILRPAMHRINPAMAAADWFGLHHGHLDPLAYGRHTLIVTLIPERSMVIRPGPDLDPDEWQWTDVQLALD